MARCAKSSSRPAETTKTHHRRPHQSDGRLPRQPFLERGRKVVAASDPARPTARTRSVSDGASHRQPQMGGEPWPSWARLPRAPSSKACESNPAACPFVRPRTNQPLMDGGALVVTSQMPAREHRWVALRARSSRSTDCSVLCVQIVHERGRWGDGHAKERNYRQTVSAGAERSLVLIQRPDFADNYAPEGWPTDWDHGASRLVERRLGRAAQARCIRRTGEHVGMPRISEFYGVVIAITTGGTVARTSTRPTLARRSWYRSRPGRSAGTVSPWALRMVQERAGLHRRELRVNWDRARDEGPLERIDPLP